MRATMKQRLFGWISLLVGLVLSVAAVELMAIVWMTIEDGRYSTAAELFERTQNTYVRDITKGACRYIDTLYPHPYIAFVHHGDPPCGLPNNNNIGLPGENFPTLKRTDRFVVLLTGGSVASQLGQVSAAPAPRYLEEELNNRYMSPNGKPFLVLNGGDGGAKQPQQFILFSLYAGSVDAVITLDGYNEHHLFRPYTGERLERLLTNFADVNPFVADENFGDAAIGWVMGRLAGTLAQNPILGRSHAAYMIIRGIEAVAKSKDIFTSTKKTTFNSIFALPPEVRGNGERVFEVQLDLYRKYMRAIEAVARDNGVRTAYFLQPIPGWGKVLSEDEKRMVGANADARVFRRMVAGLMTLRDRGLAVHDLGDLLQNVPETIYADDIHFYRDPKNSESKGYRMMAARIGGLLAEDWKLDRKP